MLEKITSKIEGWRANILSIIGKGTLIRSGFQFVPIYTMYVFKVPKNICKKAN